MGWHELDADDLAHFRESDVTSDGWPERCPGTGTVLGAACPPTEGGLGIKSWCRWCNSDVATVVTDAGTVRIVAHYA